MNRLNVPNVRDLAEHCVDELLAELVHRDIERRGAIRPAAYEADKRAERREALYTRAAAAIQRAIEDEIDAIRAELVE